MSFSSDVLRLDLLPREVVEFSQGAMRLGMDLERLVAVSRVDAPDAVVFYAARVLEVLAAAAVGTTLGEPSSNVYGNLLQLAETGLLHVPRSVLLHALRRLGNDARHGRTPASRDDADAAVALLTRALGWFFAELPTGPRISGFAHCELVGDSVAEWDSVLAVVEAQDAVRVAAIVGARRDLIERSPVLTALAAEAWIRVGDEGPSQALTLLEHALATAHSHDVRLRQLRGWALRLTGQVDACVSVLEQLVAEGREDVETLGILAGTYKRLWADGARWRGRPDRERDAALQRAATLYAQAWKRSSRRSAYVGVNAASTAHLVGRSEQGRATAADVVALYNARRGSLAPGEAIAFTGYWDLVSLAEAELLQGSTHAARARFADAFARYRDCPTYIASTRFQLALLLPALGVEQDVDAFVKPPDSSRKEGRPMTTYRPQPLATEHVELPESLREAVERVAQHVHERWAERRIADGWTFGPERNDACKTHPDLVPYADLPESEKEYDRTSATETVKALLEMGYRIER